MHAHPNKQVSMQEAIGYSMEALSSAINSHCWGNLDTIWGIIEMVRPVTKALYGLMA